MGEQRTTATLLLVGQDRSVGISRVSLIRLLALSNFRYSPLLLESFLHLRLFSPDECTAIGLLWIILKKQQGNWNAAAVLRVGK